MLVIVGLGAYSLFNDMFVGMNTIFTNTYEVDDYVEINGFRGQVIEISINKTIIRSTSGEVKTITNGTIKEVTNFSKNPISASVYVPIENTRDTLEFINKLEEKLKVLKDEYPQIIEGPIVNGIEDFKDGNVIIKVSAKTKYEMKHIVERAIRKKIFELCKKYDIRIGTSKVDVKEINYE
jgi:moderate conductance mechanosensitive channel